MNCFIILLPKQKWNGNAEERRQQFEEGHGSPGLPNGCTGTDVGGGRPEALRRAGQSSHFGFDRRTIVRGMGRIGREGHERSFSIQRLTRPRGLG